MSGSYPQLGIAPDPAAAPQTNIELRIECFDLPDLDTFSKSDPRVYVYLHTGAQWVLVGKTEVVWNNLNPCFATPIVLAYTFERTQPLRFIAVDVDAPQTANGALPAEFDDPLRHDYMGYVDANLAAVVAGSRRQAFERELRGEAPPDMPQFRPVAAGRRGTVRRVGGTGQAPAGAGVPNGPLARASTVGTMASVQSASSGGSRSMASNAVSAVAHALSRATSLHLRSRIKVVAEELRESGTNEFVAARVVATNLDKKDFFGLSDPFLVVEKRRDDGTWVQVHRTEFIKKTLSPSWQPFRLSLAQLCNSSPTRPLRWSVWDWNQSGNHSYIGAFEAPLMRIQQGARFEVVNEKKRDKKGAAYRNSGEVAFAEWRREVEWSFLDFVARGCEVSLAVAVDFTQSNGHPSQPNSLHHISTARPNEYERAMAAVGSVLEPYDSDRQFPAYGFGAKIDVQGYRTVSHIFPLNLNYDNPVVAGVQGMMEAYRLSLGNVELWGPTNFAPVITETTRWALGGYREGSQTLDRYSVLLIITDGVITDLPDTIDAVVAASRAPLSIIIVGVGGADFGAMVELDADERPLVDSRGVQMERDAVQFVPFRQFQHDHAALAAETLAEIPKQFSDWCKKRGVRPVDT